MKLAQLEEALMLARQLGVEDIYVCEPGRDGSKSEYHDFHIGAQNKVEGDNDSFLYIVREY